MQYSEKLHQHDALVIPENFSFNQVNSLSSEMIERLERTRPRNFGDARRVPGLTPAGLSTLLVHLATHDRDSLPTSPASEVVSRET